jgi:purine-nucleoside phosphorylase
MSTSDAAALTPDATRVYRKHVDEAAAALRNRLSPVPSRALVFYPALDGGLEAVSSETPWSPDALPHLPTREERPTTLAAGEVGSTSVLVLNGGLTLADGFTPREVVFPIRVLVEAGVDTLIFVQTAESLVPEIAPSDLMLVTDHINWQGANPLVGPNVDDWGPRFPDMTAPYAPALRRAAEDAAAAAGLSLRRGVYLARLGPDRCSRAEARMARTIGADVVGTTTVPEVIAARHMNASVMAVSAITRRLLPAGSTREAPDPSTALTTARPRLSALLDALLTDPASDEGSM